MNRAMGKNMDWRVRDGDEKDLEGILFLRRIVFGEVEEDRGDPRFWRWLFQESPGGKGLIYIVEDRGRIIGHFADVPKRFSLNGREVFGTLSLDLMVHPDYQRKGIFSELGRYAAQRVKAENGLFMTAFPIRMETIQGLKKIGWQVISKLPILVFPIQFSGILKHYIHFTPLRLLISGVSKGVFTLLFGLRDKVKKGGIEVEEVTQLDHQFDRFWQEVLSREAILTVRDHHFLSWRYFQHPTRRYTIYRGLSNGEMKGYIILRKVDLLKFNSAVIVDLLASDEKILFALIEKGIEFSRREKADLLGFMVPKRHHYYKILKRRGFLPSFKSFLFMVYSHVDHPFIPLSEKWYVNWGDTDVI